MFIWTSKTFGVRAAAILALTSLSGCVVDNIGAATTPGARAMLVSQGAVTVAGPAGYCIDKGTSKDRSSGAFVLLGTCAALTKTPGAGQPGVPAILTASILPGAPKGSRMSESFPATARFFRSQPGRAALSGSGNPDDVSVADVVSRGEVLYLRLTDRSIAAGQTLAPEYWRAIMAINGRIVTLSALSLRDRPMPASAKRRILEAFVARMLATNR